jgi:hypothetical protein
MSTPPIAQTAQTAAERFAALIAPQRRRTDRVTDNEEFMAMLYRFTRALEYRADQDPAMLLQVKEFAKRVAEIPDVVIAQNAARYAIDPARGMSVRECADVLGISQPAGSQRRKVGDRIIGERLAANGGARFSEAARERDMIKAASEPEDVTAVTVLNGYKARHLRVA